MSKATLKKNTLPPKKRGSGLVVGTPDSVSATERGSSEVLPNREEREALLSPVRAFGHDAGHGRVRAFLDRLAVKPPQVLLFEGGTAEERLAAAHYWTTVLNCEKGEALPAAKAPETARALDSAGIGGTAKKAHPSCLACSTCVRMVAHLHRDCFFLDGMSGSIKIDEVRALRNVLGEPPREARYRVVIFREAQALGEAAANALLKSLEEPRPTTAFMLLVPQRERLLSTLVSRSFILTLPWPVSHACEDVALVNNGENALVSWEKALYTFLRSGKGLFEHSGIKGAVNGTVIQEVLTICRKALVRRLKAGRNRAVLPESLDGLFAHLPEMRLRMLDEALAECQESLFYGVNPVLVLEWLATRMYFLLPRN